jgi:hypothetical protein
LVEAARDKNTLDVDCVAADGLMASIDGFAPWPGRVSGSISYPPRAWSRGRARLSVPRVTARRPRRQCSALYGSGYAGLGRGKGFRRRKGLTDASSRNALMRAVR